MGLGNVEAYYYKKGIPDELTNLHC